MDKVTLRRDGNSHHPFLLSKLRFFFQIQSLRAEHEKRDPQSGPFFRLVVFNAGGA